MYFCKINEKSLAALQTSSCVTDQSKTNDDGGWLNAKLTRGLQSCVQFSCVLKCRWLDVRTGECTDTVQTLYRYCTSVPPGPRRQTPGRNHLFRGDLATAVCCHCQHCARQMVTSPCALLSASSQHALVTRQGCW